MADVSATAPSLLRYSSENTQAIADAIGEARAANDITAPVVVITTPAAGAVLTGLADAAAQVTDDTAVAGVVFLLDGVPVSAEVTGPLYAVNWDTRTVDPGGHTLTTVARDGIDNQGVSQAVPVTVEPFPAEDVVWTNVVGVTVSANDLNKPAGTDGWNAGAVSTRAIAPGDGYVEFTATETSKHRIAGLSRGDMNQDSADVDFAVYLPAGGPFQVYESGVLKAAFGVYEPGDRFRVAVEGGAVNYRRNGTLFYTSGTAPQYPLLLDAAVFTVGGTISDARIAGTFVPNRPPVAEAGGPYSGTTAAAVPLVGSASTDPDGNITSYQWSFGDATTGAGVIPTHLYAAAGTFTATLTVADSEGLTSVDTTTVTVATPLPVEPVMWTNVVGATANENDLSRPAGSDGWTAGAVSTRAIASGDGFVRFTATETDKHRIAGLSRGDSSQDSSDVDFGIYLPAGGPVQVYESGALEGIFGGYAAGDAFRVAVEGGVVTYRHNGVLFYTSAVAPQYPLSLDASIFTVGGTINNARISGLFVPNRAPVAEAGGPYAGTVAAPVQLTGSGSTDPDGNITTYEWSFGDGMSGTGMNPAHLYASAGIYTATLIVRDSDGASASDTSAVTVTPVENVAWANVVGVTPSGNGLSKAAGVDGWNAGAISTRSIGSGEGYVEFTATETSKHRIAGLSKGDADQDSADVDFGVYLPAAGPFQVYEAGVLKAAFGAYAPGDRFRIAVEGGVVKYRRNGVLFYTSGTAPQYPLLLDASIFSVGGTISDAQISGALQ